MFISTQYINYGKCISIDGSAVPEKATKFSDGGKAVQLRRARQEESGFNWMTYDIKEVKAKKVIIYDYIDINCLQWFIVNDIKINFTEAFVSPDAFDDICNMCDSLKARNIKVVAGSSICIGKENGLSGMYKSESTKMKCEALGFTVMYAC